MAGNARDFIPALKYGNKILPSDLAGMLNLPSIGTIFYVDPTAGSDTANSGTAQNDAFATVKHAFDQAVSGNHDVILVHPTGGTGRTSETQAITWNKRFTHLIGSAAPTALNPRAGIGFAASLSPCLTISENGCIFQNITIASFATNDILVDVTGEYNYFGNVHFIGIGSATSGASATARSLRLTGAGENLFEGCTIGIDTVTRSAANASLELTGSCPRNIFRNCLFPIFTTSADALFVKADTGNCNERFLIFENCIFTNPTNGSSTTLTIAMDLSATGNGFIYLKDCMVKGVTDWTNTYTDLFVNMPVVNTANQGFAIIAAT